jgi:peptide/nickel transport system ATP-binding protein
VIPKGTVADDRDGQPGSPVVAVTDLRLSLRRGGAATQVLRGVSLEICRGEIVAAVGQSGSGKTVLGLTLLGLLPASSRPVLSGAAVVAGIDMTKAPAAERRRVRRDEVGVVFQDPMTSLNPTMTVGRQVTEAAGTREEAIRLMQAADIPQPEQRFGAFPHQLSGGLRQRVMIAMAIAGNPSLVIADEPTTALDVTVQAQVLRVLRGLRDDIGCSVLMITHDLGVAAQVADRIVVMQAGEVVEEGPVSQVLTAPGHPYTRELLRARLELGAGSGSAGPPPPPANGERPAAPHREPGRRPLLSLTEVTCDFQVRDGTGRRARLQALRGVTADIGAGECVALVGESGSGKSTLLRAIAGLERGWQGSVEGPRRYDIQMVFQDPGASLTPWLTVRELLTERLRRTVSDRAARRARITQTLEMIGLPQATLDARPAELSGGQRQRVALARATIVPPKVLLCDEPTSALDVSLAATVLHLIDDLRRELGMTVLFVTHDLGVARFIADRIAVMYLGRLVEVGPADAVVTDPKHPYTRALIAAVPGAGRPLPEPSGEPASPLAPPTGCSFHPRCPVARPECPSTLTGIQLVQAGPRAATSADRHAVACVLHSANAGVHPGVGASAATDVSAAAPVESPRRLIPSHGEPDVRNER